MSRKLTGLAGLVAWLLLGCAMPAPAEMSENPVVEEIDVASIEPVPTNVEWRPVVQTIDGTDMALVPPGCFQMGLDNGIMPMMVHEVCFDAPFWIDVYEVTNEQYGTAGYAQGDDFPRDNVTWAEAANHCIQRGARLPTEAEWEYAARGPDGLDYPWGDTFDETLVIYQGSSELSAASVGSLPAGASWVGALDMSGNVAEWVNSHFEPYPYDASDGREDPGSGERVVRGGAYTDDPDLLRAGQRAPLNPGNTYNSLGFRCAMSAAGDGTALAEDNDIDDTSSPSVMVEEPLPAYHADGAWVRAGYMAEPRYMLSAVTVDGLIYVSGGTSGADTFDVFDSTTEEWRALADLPDERTLHMSVAHKGQIYVMGGVGLVFDTSGETNTWQYDPASGTWANRASMPEGRWGGAAVAAGEYIYVVGGRGNTTAVLRYDPAVDSWTELAGLGSNRWGVAAAAIDGKIYLIGGTETPQWDGVEVAKRVDVYDIATDAWKAGPALPEGLFGHSTVAFENTVVVLGGGSFHEYLDTVYALDIANGEWTAVGPMPAGNAWAGTTLVDDSIVLVGGTTRVAGVGMSAARAHGRVLIYQP